MNRFMAELRFAGLRLCGGGCSRRRSRLVVALCAWLLAGVGLVPARASADPWTAAALPLPSGASSAELYGISCPASGACTAVGEGPYSTTTLLAWDQSGGSWRLTQLPLPSTADSDATLTFSAAGNNQAAFSCWGAGDCAALIHYYTGSTEQDGLEVESNGSWTSYALSEPDGLPWGDANFQTLVCQPSGTCTAFGVDTEASSGLFEADITPGGAVTFNPVVLPAGAPTNDMNGDEPMVESCPATGSCSAAGIASWAATAGNDFGDFAASGTSAVALPSPSADVDFAGGGMSCPTAGSCVAATLSVPKGSSVTTGLIWAEQADGSYAIAPVQFPAGSPGSSTSFDSVSCVAAGDCTAGGRYVDTGGHVSGFFELLANGSWSDFVPPAPADAASDPANGVGDVGCSTDGICAAMGAYTQTSGDRSLVLYSGAGMSWKAYGETLPGLPSAGGIQPTGVSCTTGGSCAAAGYYGTSTSNEYLPFVFTNGDEISGTVTHADGTPLAGAQLDLTGTDSATGQAVSRQTTTGQDGSYSFTVDPGSYAVAPVQPGSTTDGRFLDTSCSGSTQPDVCQLLLGTGADGTGDFRLDDLVVNSTAITADAAESLGDGVCDTTPSGPDETCTLAAAIQIANQTGGGRITFNIPHSSGNVFDGSVPQIRDPAGMAIPALTAPTTIDGSTQPGAGRVEVSGEVQQASTTHGLVVESGGGGSTIKGLVINGFQEMIDLRAGGDTVAGNWLGTDVAGTAADPTPLGPAAPCCLLPVAQVAVRVESSGNQIGGPVAGQGNVIASGYTMEGHGGAYQPPVTTYGLQGAGEIDDTAGGNVIQGNSIGLAPGSGARLIGSAPTGPKPLGIMDALSLSGAADTVGGSGPGYGNVFAGGGTIGGGSVLQGNSITDGGLLDQVDLPAEESPLTVNGAVTVGGQTRTPGEDDGNAFSAIDPENAELVIEGRGAVVQGNAFHHDRLGAIVDSGTDVTIGGEKGVDFGNLIDDNGDTPAPILTSDGFENGEPIAAVRVVAEPGDHSLIEHNDFQFNRGGGAVSVEAGTGATVTDNVMRANAQSITFQGVYDYDGDKTPDSLGPNGYQYYPLLFGAYRHADGIRITGHLTGIPQLGGTYRIELYSQTGCASDFMTPGRGEHYLGAQHLYAVAQLFRHPLGVLFTLTFPPAAAGDEAITATATAPDGSTSEYSPCLTIGHKTHFFKNHGVTPTSTTIAVSAAASPAADTASVLASTSNARQTSKGKRAHGALNLFCPPGTTGHCSGTFAVKTRGSPSERFAHGAFKILPDEAHVVILTIAGKLLARLERAHRLRAVLTITAHDGAKHPHHKTNRVNLTLKYTATS